MPLGGDTLLGYHLPGGTEIGHNIPAAMQMTELWGQDVEVFRPERWLEAEADLERLRELVAAVELIFGSGKYQCLGRLIAQTELNKVIVEVSAQDSRFHAGRCWCWCWCE